MSKVNNTKTKWSKYTISTCHGGTPSYIGYPYLKSFENVN